MILIWFFQEELNSKFRKIIRVEERKKFDTVSNWISQGRENYFIISGAERKNGGYNGLE